MYPEPHANASSTIRLYSGSVVAQQTPIVTREERTETRTLQEIKANDLHDIGTEAQRLAAALLLLVPPYSNDNPYGDYQREVRISIEVVDDSPR